MQVIHSTFPSILNPSQQIIESEITPDTGILRIRVKKYFPLLIDCVTWSVIKSPGQV